MPETNSVGARQPLSAPSIGLLAVVLVVGGLVGYGLRTGADNAAGHNAAGIDLPTLPAIEAAAMASQVQDNFVLATGFVDEGIEGVFFLDFLTGDLRGGVVSERGPGFNALFEYNIAADFAAAGVKNPKYMMVPGVARNLRQTGNRLGHCLLYVVEATSGQMAAYAIPFNPALYAAGKPQKGRFVPVARAQLRQQYVRDQ